MTGASPVTILSILRKHGIDNVSQSILDGRRDELMVDYLDDKLTLKQLCEKYSVSKTTLRQAVNRWELSELTPHRGHASESGGWSKYCKNEHYFDQIDTPEKAYWLGLIYADGYNGESPTWSFVLGLKSSDMELVEKLSVCIMGCTRLTRVKPSVHEWKGQMIRGSGAYRLTVYSRCLSEALARAGARRNKSMTLQFPTVDQVPSHLVRHFMLGYFDGDGCLASYQRMPYRKRYSFSIISTTQFCTEFGRVLEREVGVKSHTHKQLKMTILTLNKNDEIEKVLRWMYQDTPVWLPRKRAIYDQLCAYNISHPKAPTYSKHKGITFDKAKLGKKNPWIARVRIDGKDKTVGCAPTEEEAVRLRTAFLSRLETVSKMDASLPLVSPIQAPPEGPLADVVSVIQPHG